MYMGRTLSKPTPHAEMPGMICFTGYFYSTAICMQIMARIQSHTPFGNMDGNGHHNGIIFALILSFKQASASFSIMKHLLGKVFPNLNTMTMTSTQKMILNSTITDPL
jgi:hypothetical protein